MSAKITEKLAKNENYMSFVAKKVNCMGDSQIPLCLLISQINTAITEFQSLVNR